MSTIGFKKLFMVRNSQDQNKKQKKARARKVNNENEKIISTDREEINPLLQQIEMLKTKAMEWQEEVRSKDENSKLIEQIAQLEDISRRLETQIRQVDAVDGRMAEQTHQIGKKIAYQMGQITDRFDELERVLSRDFTEGFAEMLEKIDSDTDNVTSAVSDEKLDQVKTQIFERLDQESQNKTTSENLEQLKADIFARMDRELLNKKTPATDEKLEEVKVELFARIDRVLASTQVLGNNEKIDSMKLEILRKIDGLAIEEDSAGSDEKLDVLKAEICEHVHKESVKQYRNIQLLLDEESAVKDGGTDMSDIQKEVKSTSKLVKIAVVLGVLNIGVLTAFILMQFDVFQNLL